MSVKLALQLGVVSALGVCVAPPLWSGQLAGGSEQVEVSEERVSALEQRVSRAEAFFEELSGSERAAGMTLPQSFPKYVGAPLSDVDYLRLARSEIRAAFEQRARVRRASAPDGLDEDEQAAWEQRLRRQLELEDRLDLLRERVLAGLIDGLRVAPGFESDSFERQLESFRDLRRASVLAGTREQALELVELESRLVRYRSAAYRRMIQGDDGRLSELVNLDLEVLGDHDADLPETDVVAMARLDRLRRALPLLDASLAARVVEALGEPPAGAAGVGLSVSTDTDTGDTSADNLPSASERLAVLRERLSAIESAETRRAALVASELNRLSEQVDSLGSQSAEARGASRFEPSRADRLDAAYVHARELAETIRITRHAHRRADQRLAVQAIETRARIPAPTQTSGSEQSLAWAELALDMERVFDERRARLAAEHRELLALLDRSLAERRRLASFATSGARALQIKTIQEEFLEEILEAPVWLWRECSTLGRWFQSLGERSGELPMLRSLFYRSLDLLVVLLGWLYVRSRATAWIARLVESRRRGPRETVDPFTGPGAMATSELDSIALPATDAVAWLVLHYFLLPRSTLLAFVALIGLSRGLYRSISSLLRILVSRSRSRIDPLTGEVAMTLESKALWLRTARWALTWWIGFTVLGFFAWPLVNAFWWERLLFVGRWAMFVAIALHLLARWSRPMRSYLIEHVEHNRFTVWLTRPHSSTGAIIATLVGSIYLSVRAVFRLLVGFGWFRSIHVSMARSQLRAKAHAATPLDPGIVSRILAEPGPRIPRNEELARLRGHYVDWRSDGRRGMVAVVGDRGVGKTAFLEQASDVLRDTESDTTIRMSFGPTTRSMPFPNVLAHFAESLSIDLGGAATGEDATGRVQEELSRREPTVVIVDDFHFLLRRAVGGFSMVRRFLSIMQACSYRHFWVIGLHRPAWRYVKGVSQSVRLGFRDEITLAGFDAKRIRDNLVSRTGAAGFELDYDPLVPDRVLDEDRSRAAARARATYWQLLTQSSAGNPTVATEYWIASLGHEANGSESDDASAQNASAIASETPSTIGVHLFNPHLVSEVESMSDEYLFVLTALVVHDGLSLPELAEVLNQSPGSTHLSCQHLESLGILRHRQPFYTVAPSWQPAVLHVLDQKSFAHTA